jgi:DNA-binding protein HU-beta
MTKADIVNEIAKNSGLQKTEIKYVVDSFLDTVKESMEKGSNIYLRGFGTFKIKKKAEKTARDISRNKTITIPAHNVPAFKPSKDFVEGVKQNVKVE